MPDDKQRLSFGSAAAHYDKARPSYPAAAVTWALAKSTAGGRRRSQVKVIDLGAGTGLLTRVILGAGFSCTPVEPDPAMRTQLAEATPGVAAVAGSAEEIPFPDASVDAVIAGQAYHWFDPERAHPEIARVLRPAGVIAAIWNDRDVETSWTRWLDEILNGRLTRDRGCDFGPRFTAMEVAEFPHGVGQTPAGLRDLIASRSYYLTASPARQAELLDEVSRLCSEHPALRGRSEFRLPYVTRAYRAQLK